MMSHIKATMENAANKKKPRGLKKSSEKKEVVPIEEESDAMSLPADLGAELELALEQIKETDDMDVAEIDAFYRVALGKLNAGDVDSATLLFRATIHECDKLLRTRLDPTFAAESESTEADVEAESSKTVPPRFYLIYGATLVQLGKLVAMEEFESRSSSKKRKVESVDSPETYFDEAKERFENGIDKVVDGETELKAVLEMAIAKCHLEKANYIMRKSKKQTKALKRQLEEIVDSAWKLFISVKDGNIADSSLDFPGFAQLMLDHVEFYDDLEVRRKWIEHAEQAFSFCISMDENSVDCLIGLGNCHLAFANSLFDEIDEDAEDLGDDFPTDLANEHINKALDSFRKAKNVNKDEAVEIRILCLLGEALIQLGNLKTDDETAHQEAIQCFKTVNEKNKDALPEQFAEFLADWENDMDED